MYRYEDIRPKIFTDEGQKTFLKVRDEVHRFLDDSGAFIMDKLFYKVFVSNNYMQLAYIDRLIELGEIKEVKRADSAWQRIFIKK